MPGRLSGVVVVVVCALAAEAGAVPERWKTGAALDGDRSGDVRAAAIDLMDRVAASDRVVSIPRRRAVMPDSIRVWRRALDGSTSSCAGRVDVIPFETYVRGVLPHEWIPSWHAESLKAGAVAIRTYAAAWVDAGGKYDCADLDDTTASQVYRDETLPATDAAVAATAGVHLVKDGGLVFAEYSAENGDPTEFAVDEPLCTGETRFGHGRGTCQWGSQRWASEAGKGWQWIALHYYPGAELAGLAPRWDAALAAESYPAEMQAGEQVMVWVEYENLGTAGWNQAMVGTSGPRDRESAFFAEGSWISPSRPAADPAAGRFAFALRAPSVEETTVFSEEFGLVTGGGLWFGPTFTWTIAVHPVDREETPPAPEEEEEDEEVMVSGGCGAARGGGLWLAALALLGLFVRDREIHLRDRRRRGRRRTEEGGEREGGGIAEGGCATTGGAGAPCAILLLGALPGARARRRLRPR
jgi:hypothetical protein